VGASAPEAKRCRWHQPLAVGSAWGFFRWPARRPGTIHGGGSGVEPNRHVLIDVDLPPGDYGLLCFLPDSKDGKPHYEHGMAKELKASS
jgi:hypothetical protein